MLNKRLENYFYEASKHKELIKEALEVLTPLTPIKEYEALSSLEKFALNAFIFRFSKLQDLIGSKVFRNYLDYSGYDISDKNFFDILKEIEKEGIIDIDSWDEFRQLRNQIAHEYPNEVEEMLDSINLFIKKSYVLLDVSEILEKKYSAIKRERERDN